MKFYSSKDIKVGANVYEARIPKDSEPIIRVSIPEYGAGLEVPEPTEIRLSNADKAITTLRGTIDFRGKSVVTKEHWQSYNEADETITQFTGIVNQTQIGIEARLDAVSIDTGFLETEIPIQKITQEDWNEAVDIDQAVSVVIGNNVQRVPCNLIIQYNKASTAGLTNYSYLIGKGDLTIHKVYRNDKPITEYSGSATSNGAQGGAWWDEFTLNSALERSDNFYQAGFCEITSGTLTGRIAPIIRYTSDDHKLGFYTLDDMDEVLSGDTFTIREWRKRLFMIPNPTPVLDDFDRTNEGPPPSTSWTDWTGQSGLKVLSNHLVASAAGVKAAAWNTVFNADMEAGITAISWSQTDATYFELRLRWDGETTNPNYYFVRIEIVQDSFDSIYIRTGKVVAGVETELGAQFGEHVMFDSDVISIESGLKVFAAVIGYEVIAYLYFPSIPGWQFWSSRYDVDESISGTGQVAVGIQGVNWILDDFYAANASQVYTGIQFAIAQKISDKLLRREDITADVTGLQTQRNPVRALEYFIDEVGAAKNQTAFDNAAALVPSGLYIDGALTEPKRLIDVLNDIALIGRVRLTLNASGEFEPIINQLQTNVYGLFDTASNNLQNFEPPVETDLSSLIANVSVKYRKKLSGNGFLLESAQHTAIAAGKRDLVIESDWITDKTTADMVANFVAKWLAATDRVYSIQLGSDARARTRGELIKLTIPELTVDGNYHILSELKGVGYGFLVYLYDATVWDYTAGILPDDPVEPVEDSLIFQPPEDPNSFAVQTNGATQITFRVNISNMTPEVLERLRNMYIRYKLNAGSTWIYGNAPSIQKNVDGLGVVTSYDVTITGLTASTAYDFEVRFISIFERYGGKAEIINHSTTA